MRNAVLWGAVCLSVVLGMGGMAEAEVEGARAAAVWVAEGEGVLKVAAADGAVLFEIPDPGGIEAVAVDGARRVVWAYGQQGLRAFDESGSVVAEAAVALPSGALARLAIDRADGEVYAGAGSRIQVFDRRGAPLRTLALPGELRALAFEGGSRRLWAATAGALAAYDRGAEAPALRRQAGSARLGGAVLDLALADAGDGLWVARAKRLDRYGADGALRFARTLPGILHLAADGGGGLWAATATDLVHLDAQGQRDLSLAPFFEVGTIVGLAAQGPGSGVWVANEVDLAEIDRQGRVVRRVAPEPPVEIRGLALLDAPAEPPARRAAPRAAVAPSLAPRLASTQTAVAGTVLLPSGQPAAGVTVAVLGIPGATGTTDASGHFSLSPVAIPSGGQPLAVVATAAGAAGPLFASANAAPVAGGTTNAGTLVLAYACAAQFASAWLPSPAVNGDIRAMVVFDDGTGPALYVGGTFTTAGAITANGVARWNGSAWSGLGAGFNTTTEVDALAVWNDGSGSKLYAAGNFTKSGTTATGNVAKWTGTSWVAVGSATSGPAGQVFALASFGGNLYAGGSFTKIGTSTTANRIAKWNGTSWSVLGSGTIGLNGTVKALATYTDGSGQALFVGGAFTTAGTVTAKAIARWSGSAWSALSGGATSTSAEVDALASDGTYLYAGGKFTTVANGSTSVAANYVARWNGTAWSALGSGLASQVLALAVFDDGTGPALYAGGSFNTIGSTSYGRLARWSGSSWGRLATGVNNTVYALASFGSGTGPALYAGGSFTTASGGASAKLAKWYRPASCDDQDETPPLLVITSPGEGDVVPTPSPTITLGFADGGSGVPADPNFLNIMVGGDTVAVGCTWHTYDAECVPQSPLPLGAVTVSAVVFDRAGNASNTATVDFTIQDTTAPVLSIASPASGAVVATAYPALVLSANDGNGSGLDPSSWSVQWNGSALAVECQTGATTSTCVPVEPVAAGPATVTVSVADLAGNRSATASVSFTVSPPPPTTTVAGRIAMPDGSPAAGASVRLPDAPGLFATAGADGSFSIAGVAVGASSRLALAASLPSPRLSGFVNGIVPVPGGVTQVGTVTLKAACDVRFATVPFRATDAALVNDLAGSIFSLTSALAYYDDGSGPALYAGGSFDKAGGHPAGYVARWNGSAWSDVGGSAFGPDGAAVNALVAFDDGGGTKLYAAGLFSSAGGRHAGNFARWDGHAWEEAGNGVSDAVAGMVAFQEPGKPRALYLVGSFTAVDQETTWDGRSLSLSAAHAAKWDGQQWTAMGSGALLGAQGLAVLDDGSGPALYAHNGQQVARWSSASQAWSVVFDISSVSGFQLWSAVQYDDGSGPAIYLGGQSFLVKLKNGVATQVLSGSAVSAMAVVASGTQAGLYLDGEFNVTGFDRFTPTLARWNGSSLSGPLSTDPAVAGLDLALFSVGSFGAGASLFPPGAVLYAGDTVQESWNGSAWTAFSAAGDTTGDVRSVASFDDGTGEAIYFAGPQVAQGVTLSGGIGRWDGHQVTSVGAGLEGGGSAVFTLDDGTGRALYAVASAAGRVAKWNGSSWVTLGAPLGVKISALGVADLGSGPRLYAGGDGLYRWNGAFWTSLGGPTGILAIAGASGGVYVGGRFSSVGPPFATITAHNVALWDGTSWSALGSGQAEGVDGPSPVIVYALKSVDGILYVGGNFWQAGGSETYGLAAWGGSSWVPWLGFNYLQNANSYAGAEILPGTVYALETYDDGEGTALVVGGQFQATGSPSSGVSTLLYHNLNLGSGTDGTVYALAPSYQGGSPSIAVGGAFLAAGGMPSAKLAIWETGASFAGCRPAGEPPVLTLTSPADGSATAQAQTTVAGAVDEPAAVTVGGISVAVAPDSPSPRRCRSTSAPTVSR